MDRPLPTLSDVAQRAGVSYATADRVVNARGGVAEKSASRVRAAIEELGYVRNLAAANLSQQRHYRFVAVLPGGDNAFFKRMCGLLEAAADRLRPDRVGLTVETVEAFDAPALCARLEALGGDGVDGLALVGSDDPRVLAAIADLRARGIPVLTLVSDVPGADSNGYVGIDNTVAGRTAGRLIVLAHGGQPGRVLPVVGALSARDHADRVAGLRAVIRPRIAVAPVIEGRDRKGRVAKRVAAALQADPGITAIYSAGAGNAGLIKVLESLPRDRPRPIVVLHELVPHSRRALERGLIDIVIDQRPEDAVARVVEGLRLLADKRELARTDPILPTIYLADNLPASDTSQKGETSP